MTLAEALGVRERDHITSVHTIPIRVPLTVTRVWVNDARTIVRFWVHALSLWLPYEAVELAPKGHEWTGGGWKPAAPKFANNAAGRAARSRYAARGGR